MNAPARIILTLILTALASGAAPSSSAPATHPADVDPSTPRGALRALAQALAAGDRAAVLERLAADTPQDQQLANATADLAEATAQLRKAAVGAFGQESAAPLGADLGASPQALKRIDASRVEVNADRATVRPADADGPPLVLVQRQGAWRVPVAELSKDVESADVQRSIDAMLEQSKQMKALAAEVSAGKFKSAVDARQELDKRIVQSAMPRGAGEKPK